MAALHCARQAVEEAGWSADELRHAGLVLGTSRGNAAGWLGDWPGRRPFKLMAASNTIHSEPAAAISIELGITGPNHVLASGCSAGLDALGLAMMLLDCGMAKRVIAVAVDLPLVPVLLDNYAASGLLSSDFHPDPYGSRAHGFVPAEGAAAMALQKGEGGIVLSHYACNADAEDAIGTPRHGGRTPEMLTDGKLLATIGSICPHATGTAVLAKAEPEMFRRVFGDRMMYAHLLKPFCGHAIGASGLVETTILSAFMREGKLPPNRSGLSAPEGLSLMAEEVPATAQILKLSHAMGGHNAMLVIGTHKSGAIS